MACKHVAVEWLHSKQYSSQPALLPEPTWQ